jgi:hypothetical protein
MANVLIAHIIDNEIVLWTDANPVDENYTRRNFFQVGNHCVVLHDDLVPWLSIIQPILANPTLSSLPADQLADAISQQLRSLSGGPINLFGLIIAGFVANGSPVLLGLHSAQAYVGIRYPTSVSAGVIPAIWNYLISVLQTIPKTLDNVIDMCLIAGLAYREVQQFSGPAFSAGSAIAIVSQRQILYWVPEAEIQQRQAHNNRRLHALRLGLTNQLQGFSR